MSSPPRPSESGLNISAVESRKRSCSRQPRCSAAQRSDRADPSRHFSKPRRPDRGNWCYFERRRRKQTTAGENRGIDLHTTYVHPSAADAGHCQALTYQSRRNAPLMGAGRSMGADAVVLRPGRRRSIRRSVDVCADGGLDQGLTDGAAGLL